MIKIIITLYLLSSLACADKFEKASNTYDWSFPRDHGAHNNFETEWWYITGHLVEKGLNPFSAPTRYGFQITFFRKASISATSELKQEYLAHAAISDINNNKFIHASRTNQELLAGAANDKLKVWNQDWSLESFSDQMVSIINLDLKEQAGLRLIFSPTQDNLKHGSNGYSKKGDCLDCGSMYYSMPRLKVSGTVSLKGQDKQVEGLAWYDHEFFSNILGEGQIGWDWFNLMFKDGRNMMAFAVRTEKNPRAYVAGTLQNDNSVTYLDRDQINWKILKNSIMPSGTSYPTAWQIIGHNLGLKIQIDALMEKQEIQGPHISYWEGAIRSNDAIGYFEMTGYDKSIKPKL